MIKFSRSNPPRLPFQYRRVWRNPGSSSPWRLACPCWVSRSTCSRAAPRGSRRTSWAETPVGCACAGSPCPTRGRISSRSSCCLLKAWRRRTSCRISRIGEVCGSRGSAWGMRTPSGREPCWQPVNWWRMININY